MPYWTSIPKHGIALPGRLARKGGGVIRGSRARTRLGPVGRVLARLAGTTRFAERLAAGGRTRFNYVGRLRRTPEQVKAQMHGAQGVDDAIHLFN